MLDTVIRDPGLQSTMDQKPCRKRQRLDHLTAEEKLLRRKMKNRAAAQSARDRKKAHMDELEVEVDQLRLDKDKLATENDRLREIIAEQREQIDKLRQRLATVETGGVQQIVQNAVEEITVTDNSLEHALPISGPQPKDQVSMTPLLFLLWPHLLLLLYLMGTEVRRRTSMKLMTVNPKSVTYPYSTIKTSLIFCSTSLNMEANQTDRLLSRWTPHRLKT